MDPDHVKPTTTPLENTLLNVCIIKRDLEFKLCLGIDDINQQTFMLRYMEV